MTFLVYYRLRLLEVTQGKLDRVQEKLHESRFREYQLANLRKVSFPLTESDIDVGFCHSSGRCGLCCELDSLQDMPGLCLSPMDWIMLFPSVRSIPALSIIQLGTTIV